VINYVSLLFQNSQEEESKQKKRVIGSPVGEEVQRELHDSATTIITQKEKNMKGSCKNSRKKQRFQKKKRVSALQEQLNTSLTNAAKLQHTAELFKKLQEKSQTVSLEFISLQVTNIALVFNVRMISNIFLHISQVLFFFSNIFHISPILAPKRTFM